MKRPIAMKCTHEQFDAVKTKLKDFNYEIICIYDFERSSYLINNLGGDTKKISNVLNEDKKSHNRTVYETWNEKIFLEACGIEVEEPKVNILTLSEPIGDYVIFNGKKYVPEVVAFEPEKKELVVGVWYKWNDIEECAEVLIYLTEVDENSISRYGFVNGRWNDTYRIYTGTKFEEACRELREATQQEVFEALSAELKKRYNLGDYFQSIQSNWNNIKVLNYYFNFDHFKADQVIYLHDYTIYEKGKFAEIIPTITLSEAEQQLKKKIIV